MHLYEEFGDELVHALEGMFAFAIWDQRRAAPAAGARSLRREAAVPARARRRAAVRLGADRAAGGQAGLRELDPEAIDAFFVFGYVPGPGTIVPGVRQLPPGHRSAGSASVALAGSALVVAARDGTRDTECPSRCWRRPSACSRSRCSAHDRRRARRRVPQRRGRLDARGERRREASSRRLQTFTVGYDVGDVNETAQARRTAARLGTEHHEVTLTQRDVAERAPGLLARLDQPLADRATVPLHALSEFARPRVTVALGGEGADELFGGYPRYRWLERAARAESPLAGRLALARRWCGRCANAARARSARRAPARAHADARAQPRLGHQRAPRTSRGAVRAAPGRRRCGSGARDLAPSAASSTASRGRWLMHLDQVDYLPDDVLVKTDRASMLVSLEIRTVFLTRGARRARGLAGHLDAPGRRRQGAGARDAARRLHRHAAPGRYRKTAFRVPAAEWLRGPLAPVLREQLERGAIYAEGYFDRDAARALVARARPGARDHSDLLWPLLALGLWTDRFHGLDAAKRAAPAASCTPDFPPAPGGIQVLAERLAGGLRRLRDAVVALRTPGAAGFDAASAPRACAGSRARGLPRRRLALLNAAALRRGAAASGRMLTLSMHIVTSPAAAAIRRTLGARTVQYFHAKEIGAKPRLAAFAARQARRGDRRQRLHRRPGRARRARAGERCT